MGSHIWWWLSELRSDLLKKREKQPQVFSPGLGPGLCWAQMRERHQKHIPVLRMEQNSPLPVSCLIPVPVSPPKSKDHGELPHPADPAPALGGGLEPSTNYREPLIPPDSFPALFCVELQSGGKRALFQCSPRGTLRSHCPGGWQGMLAEQVNEE